MITQYRVTPKNKRWIVQRTSDRKQFGKPFRLKAEALGFRAELVAKSYDKLTVEDVDILLGNLKVFFKKLHKLRKTIVVKKN